MARGIFFFTPVAIHFNQGEASHISPASGERSGRRSRGPGAQVEVREGPHSLLDWSPCSLRTKNHEVWVTSGLKAFCLVQSSMWFSDLFGCLCCRSAKHSGQTNRSDTQGHFPIEVDSVAGNGWISAVNRLAFAVWSLVVERFPVCWIWILSLLKADLIIWWYTVYINVHCQLVPSSRVLAWSAIAN